MDFQISQNEIIELRLEAEFSEHTRTEESFNDYVSYHSKKPIKDDLALCYIPELKSNEKYLFKDERSDFKEDGEYLKLKLLCKSAIDKIKNKNGNYSLNEDDIIQFYSDYKRLYEELMDQWNYKAFHDFRCFFFYLIEWFEMVKLSKQAKEACEAFNAYNQDDIEDWLDDYNRLYFCNSVFWGFIGETVDEENNLYKVSNENFIAFIQSEAISWCKKFGELYKMYNPK